MGIRLNGKFSVCGGGRGAQSKDCDLCCSVQLVDAVLFDVRVCGNISSPSQRLLDQTS